MSEQAPSYHPAIEEVLETTGPDAGRVKKDAHTQQGESVAENLAYFEDELRSRHQEDIGVYYSEEEAKDLEKALVDEELKIEIARRVIGLAQNGEESKISDGLDIIATDYDKLQESVVPSSDKIS